MEREEVREGTGGRGRSFVHLLARPLSPSSRAAGGRRRPNRLSPPVVGPSSSEED